MDKESKQFSIRARFQSFKYAVEGIRTLFKTEHNAWIHLLATLVVLFGGIYFDFTTMEWGMVTFAIGFVFAAELINTSLEKLTDMVSPEFHPLAKKVKDLAAGAVLIAAIVALIIAILIIKRHL